jgi:hypothetical protein
MLAMFVVGNALTALAYAVLGGCLLAPGKWNPDYIPSRQVLFGITLSTGAMYLGMRSIGLYIYVHPYDLFILSVSAGTAMSTAFCTARARLMSRGL